MSEEASTTSRLERVLAYLALTFIAVAFISFVSTLIAGIAGVSRETLATSFWPLVTWVSYVGAPVGFALIVTLILLSRKRRVREYRQSNR